MEMVCRVKLRNLSIILSFLALRLVDNKAILYFDAPSPSEALNWFRGKDAACLSYCFR
jgi:hypothetical protein